MKKLKLRALDLGSSEILSREQLKNIIGANGSGSDRCSNDRLCSVYGGWDGGCATMETGQCRCVIYRNGSASESVPDSNCLA
jgi:hypothetical protein